jgi:parallel beta-helix repeat protein
MRKTDPTALTLIATSAILAASTRVTHAQEFAAQAKTPLPPGAKIILVDDDRRQFRNAPYSYINNAIYAANPGDVIRVAPGIYREAIVIDKSVRIEGAQFGRPATGSKRLGSVSPLTESILVLGTNLLKLNPAPHTVVTVRTSGAVLDGFTIQGAGTNEYRAGVGAGSGTEAQAQAQAQAGSVANFSLLNSRIENTTIGVLFSSMTNVLIQGNAFLNNQSYTSSTSDIPSGSGQGIKGELATTVSILSNLFSGNQTAGISLGIADPPPKEDEEPTEVVDVSNGNISSNRFDASLTTQPSGAGVLLWDATAMTLTKNIIRGGSQVGISLDAQDGPQSTQTTTISQNSITGVTGNGMFLSDSLLGALIERNTISGNTANGMVLSDVGAFINAFNLFSTNRVSDNAEAGFLLYLAIGNNLDGNTISGNGHGIVVDHSQDNQIKNNNIRDSAGYGIFVNAFASGNVFNRNRIQNSVIFDIADASIGDDTYGTNNIYRGNTAATANPPELSTMKKKRVRNVTHS